MDWYRKYLIKTAYGGPSFNPANYLDDYRSGRFLRYKDLFEDVQLESDNLLKEVNARRLIWFEDVISPSSYKSDLTVESCWSEDFNSGIDYLSEIEEWMIGRGEEPTDSETFSKFDKTTPKCVYRYFMTLSFETLGDDEYDFNWGPYKWYPESMGEWSRCRDIAISNERYPISILYNGQVLDGAHRLAVAIYNHESSYPCIVGVPEDMMGDSEDLQEEQN